MKALTEVLSDYLHYWHLSSRKFTSKLMSATELGNNVCYRMQELTEVLSDYLHYWHLSSRKFTWEIMSATGVRSVMIQFEKIYNKSQRGKFRWAMEIAGPDYVFQCGLTNISEAWAEITYIK
ncbi:hypothetical protein CDAR_126641 [Caerostris darwini]|uniref:Topoisomerase I C-terminal domain-containing protein n=1 Tax=Caerostris darwini TaxID=1538125 RepID=A0AAV4PKB9_9ARAC|nr:hypothetical protein CDAR_126641 [Caerostris darwini]